jgi:hypothetical protein
MITMSQPKTEIKIFIFPRELLEKAYKEIQQNKAQQSKKGA